MNEYSFTNIDYDFINDVANPNEKYDDVIDYAVDVLHRFNNTKIND